MDKDVLREIHHFWFGELRSVDQVEIERIDFWMRQNDETDRQVRDGFGHYLAPAAQVDWDVENLTREEGVGLVVLFDQFPRNIYRTTGEAFAYDELARGITRRLVANGWDRFYWVERFMLSLPYQHHEDADDQDYSVFLSAQMTVLSPPELRELARAMLDFSTKHRDLIRRFGRYPHRNVMLGRQSTPEEEAFLKEHGRGF